MKHAYCLVLTLSFAAAALAQPTVSAVENAASNALPGFPNSSIAQGSMFIVYGTNFGPAALAQASSYPLPTNLSGTSVTVSVNGSNNAAIMIYTSAQQLAAVLPSATPAGVGTITVSYNGQTSAPAPITVVPSSFGVFSVNQQGSGPGIVTFADYSLVGSAKAANPGDTLLIWGTGLGAVSGNEANGPLPGNLTSISANVFVGGVQATVTYKGRSGCCAGLDQIGFVVPQGVTGCNVPVAVQTGNVVSNFTSIAVAASGRTCSDPSGLSGTDIQTLFSKPTVSIGFVSLSRTFTQTAGFAGTAATTTKEDDGTAAFYRISIPQGNYPTSLVESVSVGACTVTTSGGQSVNPLGSFTITSLDAGPNLTVSGPAGTRLLTKEAVSSQIGFYDGKLGDTTPGNYLDPGKYTITGPGGADVGSFSTSLTLPPSFVWVNQDNVNVVNRSAGQFISWSGGDPSAYVSITGSSTATSSGNNYIGGSFTCTARVSDGSFTIPAFVLLNLPASSMLQGFSLPGELSVSTSTSPQRFSATGLDYAFATASVSSSKSVTFQ